MDNEKSYVIERKVTEDMLAVNVGSGSLRVLATPVVVAMMEEASAKLADTVTDDGITTVGTMISVEHMSPSPLNAKIRTESTLVKNEGRLFQFETVAYDESGVIAKGKHSRVLVKSEKFQKKADEKLG